MTRSDLGCSFRYVKLKFSMVYENLHNFLYSTEISVVEKPQK